MIPSGEALLTSGVLLMARSGAAFSVSVSDALAVIAAGLLSPSSVILVLLTMLLMPAATGLSTFTTNVAEPPAPPAKAPTLIVQTVPAAAPSAQLVQTELPAATNV